MWKSCGRGLYSVLYITKKISAGKVVSLKRYVTVKAGVIAFFVFARLFISEIPVNTVTSLPNILDNLWNMKNGESIKCTTTLLTFRKKMRALLKTLKSRTLSGEKGKYGKPSSKSNSTSKLPVCVKLDTSRVRWLRFYSITRELV